MLYKILCGFITVHSPFKTFSYAYKVPLGGRSRILGQPPATDKVCTFKSMQSNEIWHNSAINTMAIGVALTLLKILALCLQNRFRMIYCAKGD